MSTVWVVNKSDTEFSKGWDERTFVFKPNVPVEVPLSFAKNVLGYESGDKYDVVVRLGWTKTSTDLPEAFARLNKVEITSDRPNVYCETSPAVDRSPVPVITRHGRGKGTQAAA